MAFGIIPREALSDPDLTHSEFRLLAALYSFKDSYDAEIFPGRRAISERSGVNDVNRVSRLMSSLERKGWVRRYGRSKGWGYTRFKLSVPARLTPKSAEIISFTAAKRGL